MTGQPMDQTRIPEAKPSALVFRFGVRHVWCRGSRMAAHLAQLKRFVDSLQHVQRVNFCLYHLLGVHKYETMQLPYSLSGVPAMDQEKAAQLQEEIFPNFPQRKGYLMEQWKGFAPGVWQDEINVRNFIQKN